MNEQSKAMELAEILDAESRDSHKIGAVPYALTFESAARELRHLDAENAALRAQLEGLELSVAWGHNPFQNAQLAQGEPVNVAEIIKQDTRKKFSSWLWAVAECYEDTEHRKVLIDIATGFQTLITGLGNTEAAPQQAPASSRLEAAKSIAETADFKQKIGESIAAMPQAQLPNGAYAGAPVDEREAMGKSWMEFASEQKPYCTNVSPQDGFTAGWQARAALKPVIPSKLAGNANPLNFSNTEARVAYVMGWNGCVDSMLAAAKDGAA